MRWRSAARQSNRLQPVGLISVTIRLQPAVADALKLTSLDRELAVEEEFTQQENVQNAERPWLRGKGFLD